MGDLSSDQFPKIQQHLASWSRLHGKFYIGVDEYTYIHRGGIAMRTTQNGGEYSGYFDTEEEAELALELYQMNRSEALPGRKALENQAKG